MNYTKEVLFNKIKLFEIINEKFSIQFDFIVNCILQRSKFDLLKEDKLILTFTQILFI